jgi:tellurite methyltransferase
MSTTDAERWNKRYRQSPEAGRTQPRAFLIEQAGQLPERGRALDVAMGLGSNAGFLIERGWQVVGVDVSEVAARYARAHQPQLHALVADLTNFDFPADVTFDVILNLYYLQRDLWPRYRRWLRSGGLLIFETLTLEMLKYRSDLPPDYLLAPDELRSAFADWEILVYREGVVERGTNSVRAAASLVARRP